MSTPEQPDQPLTRKQLRDLRNTGSTPVVPMTVAVESPPEPEPDPEPTPEPDPAPAAEATPAPAAAPIVTAAPLPRAAEPVIVPAAPVADSSVDLGVSPLTRRQARQQERIRTASVPVITPEVAAAHAASINARPVTAAPASNEPQTATAALRDLFGPPADVVAAPARPVPDADVQPDEEALVTSGPQTVVASVEPEPEPEPDPWAPAPSAVASEEITTLTVVDEPSTSSAPEATPDDAPRVDPASEDTPFGEAAAGDDANRDRGVVNPLFGAGLLAGTTTSPASADAQPSFDQLLSRSATGSVGTPNALILETTGDAPIVGPVTATGEVLITGSFNLPEGLGSTGVPRGSADGKEVDATLVDGELPAHSSPTPIAASTAISTVKSAGEVIKPPAPEKGSRLMLTLAITAGVLALALVGVLILAFVTGVF